MGAAAAATDSTKKNGNGFGARGRCRPQEQIDAPRGSAAETEGGGPDLREPALIPSTPKPKSVFLVVRSSSSKILTVVRPSRISSAAPHRPRVRGRPCAPRVRGLPSSVRARRSSLAAVRASSLCRLSRPSSSPSGRPPDAPAASCRHPCACLCCSAQRQSSVLPLLRFG